ncbi:MULTISPECIES: hypothetical protein [unclassified Hahella]|uniref:hypothetical protein n=1 Tax=unclassified Hahella TaxID=2624107 RepID=UPI000FDE83C0|nr:MULTISPECIES: hypothetical protein [unclassified Hahella]AZZ90283.1 hypothetical protein ENC22_03395 [Hahella sp. KA22]MBU6955368.1 hypothetical protein [Hahella sp. HN01]MDG9668978.1 hypothetical protein [Hahella sp. CR1]QAY53653.1 hypothetical protein EUZ85_05945 [Hahella sp. KA22]WLQ12405.1 hypothetical protein O5O45_22005 [Hahella sp. HNIBRBA332]
MNIRNELAPILLQAVSDAIQFNRAIMDGGFLNDSESHFEYLVSLNHLLHYLEEEYKKIEAEVGMPLNLLALESA